MKEKKALFDDAKRAVAAALEEGVVVGGGVALLRCEKIVKKLDLEGDEKHGAEIVANVLHYPLRYIAENAGVDGDVVVNRVRQMKGKNEGYNADKDEYGDLVAAGVIDPAKVVRTALQNAASVAALAAHHRIARSPKFQRKKRKPAAAITTTTTAAVAWEEWAAWDMGGMGGMGGMM